MIEMTSYCRHGHPRTEENIYRTPKGGVECRPCRKASALASHERAKSSPSRRASREVLFGGNRELAIQRDGEKCVKCGMTRIEHKKKFGCDITVDHIDGNGKYTEPHLRNNSLDNLQTLCLSCHGSKDARRSWMRRTPEFQQLLSGYFAKLEAALPEELEVETYRARNGQSIIADNNADYKEGYNDCLADIKKLIREWKK